jgi:pectinesterase
MMARFLHTPDRASRGAIVFPLPGGLLLCALFLAACSSTVRGDARLAVSPDAVVAADGSGDFESIQAAIYAAPYSSDTNVWVIRVKAGVYKERVYVQRERGYLRLIGEDPETTVLTHGIHANMVGPDGRKLGTFRTPTLQIDGDGFIIENMTIANAAGPVGQALALRVDGDKVEFRNCRFLGWQDTIFINRGRQYFRGCYIEGHVDFIFGGSTAWFEDCHIHCLKKGYITAASTPVNQPYGFVFKGCRITGGADTRTYLGRPWRAHAMTVFLNTEMSDVVRPEGWNNWRDPEREETVRYGEYNSTGPGANPEARVPWSRQLADEEAEELSVKAVLQGEDGWVPTTSN